MPVRGRDERGGGRERMAGRTRASAPSREREAPRERDRDREPARGREREAPRGREREAPRGGREERGGRDERAGRQQLGNRRERRFAQRTAESTRVAREAAKRGNFDSPVQSGFPLPWRAEEGHNYIRVLPGPEMWADDQPNETGVFGYPVRMHTWIGANPSNYLCLRQVGQPCEACEAHAEAKRAGDDDEAYAWSDKPHWVMWILDRNADDPTQPIPYFLGKRGWGDLLAATEDARTREIINVEDPNDGYDIVVRREGTDKRTRYTFAVDRNPSPIHDDPVVQDEILDFVENNPIPTILKYYEPEYLERVVNGVVREADAELDGEDTSQDYDHEAEEAAQSSRREARGGRDRDERAAPRRGAALREPEEEEHDPETGELDGDNGDPPFETDGDPEGEAYGADPEPEPERPARGGTRERRVAGRANGRDREPPARGGRERMDDREQPRGRPTAARGGRDREPAGRTVRR